MSSMLGNLVPVTGQAPGRHPGDPGGGTPWFDDTITNPHSTDDGIDIGVPDKEMLAPGSLDNQLTAPYAGTVLDASYHVYGGEVVVDIPQSGYAEYFIHMDQIYVKPGDQITPGEVLGTSGGGVGDLVLHAGRVQPAKEQSWYEGHSSGPHTEYGLFQDGPVGHPDIHAFDLGWGNKLRQLDPTPVITALQQGNPLPKVGEHIGEATGTGYHNIDVPFFGPILELLFGDWVAFGQDVTSTGITIQTIVEGIPTAMGIFFQAVLGMFGLSNPIDGCKRVALIGCGGVLVLGGLVVVIIPIAAGGARKALAPAAPAAGQGAGA